MKCLALPPPGEISLKKRGADLSEGEKLMGVSETFSQVGNVLGSSLRIENTCLLVLKSVVCANCVFFTSRKAWTAKQVSQSWDPLVPCTRKKATPCYYFLTPSNFPKLQNVRCQTEKNYSVDQVKTQLTCIFMPSNPNLEKRGIPAAKSVGTFSYTLINERDSACSDPPASIMRV